MNVTNLILQIQSKINDSTLDQQALTKAIKLLEVGAVYTVATLAQLPPVSLNAGKLFYVEYDGLYYSDGFIWAPIATEPSMIFSWGDGFLGRLGNGTTTNRSSPVGVVGGFTDWCQVSAGGSHSLGVRANGTLWSWGVGTSGRLGNGTLIDRSSPVSVVGGFTDWCQVSAGGFHSLGVRQNGTAWAWGGGTSGQLGSGTAICRSSPVSVVGGFTDWCQVSAGSIHSLGIRQDGTAWAWGSGSSGRLGNGTTTNRSSPVGVVGGFTDWCQVSAGNAHSLGVRQDGTAWAWGFNVSGQLGDGTTISRSSPVSVVGGFTDWCQVSAGCYYSHGLRSNGTLWAWGRATCGVLGDGTLINQASPISVVGGFTDWCQVSAGTQHSAAVRKK
jgi:alpha-tubulin suppressor-like RCC1 family protein